VFDTSATFGFSATEPATFICRLDGAAFTPCSSPVTYANLAVGPHTFQVAADDDSFNVDASPAERTWSGVLQGSVSTTLTLTTSWLQVTAVYTPVPPGQSSLDVEAFTANSPTGVCFQADDASITR
jgi:hypothetical protein